MEVTTDLAIILHVKLWVGLCQQQGRTLNLPILVSTLFSFWIPHLRWTPHLNYRPTVCQTAQARNTSCIVDFWPSLVPLFLALFSCHSDQANQKSTVSVSLGCYKLVFNDFYGYVMIGYKRSDNNIQ